MTRVVVAGATGRVGRVMMAGLNQPPTIEVVGGFGSANARQELERLAHGADVLVDIRAERGTDLPDPRVERWTLEGARGAVDGGVRIHSVRLPGFNAHQEVLFGSLGQVLSIRHDALGREAYLPGVALAVREVPKRVGLVRGLDTLMGLES